MLHVPVYVFLCSYLHFKAGYISGFGRPVTPVVQWGFHWLRSMQGGWGSGASYASLFGQATMPHENVYPMRQTAPLMDVSSLMNPISTGSHANFIVAVSLDSAQQTRLYNMVMRKGTEWGFSPPRDHPHLTSAMLARILQAAARDGRAEFLRNPRGQASTRPQEENHGPTVAAAHDTRDTKHYAELHRTTQAMRRLDCVRLFRKCLDEMRSILNHVDAEGAPCPDDWIVSTVLQHAIGDANKDNRLNLTADCVPPVLRSEIEDTARATLRAEQREKHCEARMGEWMVLKHAFTCEQFRAVRSIVPKHILPSLARVTNYTDEFARKHRALLSMKRTFSGFQLDFEAALRLMLLQALLTRVAGYEFPDGCGWRRGKGIRFVAKLMVDGFNTRNLSGGGLIAAHLNFVMLPEDSGQRMTDLFTDVEQRKAHNTAGQRNSTFTVALFAGKENFHNIKTNLTCHHEDGSNIFHPDVVRAKIPSASVDYMKQVMSVFQVHYYGAKGRQLTLPQMRETMARYLDDNKAFLETMFERQPELVPEAGSKLEQVPPATPRESIYSGVESLQGASWTARLPVGPRDDAGCLRIAVKPDGTPVEYWECRGSFGSVHVPDMKCTWAVTRWGHSSCNCDCHSDQFDMVGQGDARHPVPEEGYTPRHGHGCVWCDISSCNEYAHLAHLILAQVLEHMEWPAGKPLTLRDVGAFYKVSVDQVIRWSSSAYPVLDCMGPFPKRSCSCPWVWPESFGSSAHDPAEPRKSKALDDPFAHRCSHGDEGHNDQHLLLASVTWETRAQVATLGLLSESEKAGDLRAWTAGIAVTGIRQPLPLILAVRQINHAQVNGQEALHPWLKDPAHHLTGQLHGPRLSMVRSFMELVQALVVASGAEAVATFNAQQKGLFRIEYSERGEVLKATFLGPRAAQLVDMYGSAVDRDADADMYSVKIGAHWPLAGCFPPGMLRYVLAAAWWLQREHSLARLFFMTEQEEQELHEATLEASLRQNALKAGVRGDTRYQHGHLHGPERITEEKLQGWAPFSEDIGETAHQRPKALCDFTTRGGARGRGYKKGYGGGTYLESRKGRVIAGDLHATYQVFKKLMAETLLHAEEARNWIALMEADHPGVPVFEFHLDQPRTLPRGVYPRHYRPPTVTRYDVIARTGFAPGEAAHLGAIARAEAARAGAVAPGEAADLLAALTGEAAVGGAGRPAPGSPEDRRPSKVGRGGAAGRARRGTALAFQQPR